MPKITNNKTNIIFHIALLLIVGYIDTYSQCAYEYLCKAYSAPRALKITYCDSSINRDSMYIPAYVYKFKAIYYNLPIPCLPKPRDTANPTYKAERKQKWEEAKAVLEKAWRIDSQYIKIYELKLTIDGWDKVDTSLYRKLNGEMKFRKELVFNSIDLNCKPNDQSLFIERAKLFSELGMFDSALNWADKVGFGWISSALEVKKDIFVKAKNKAGIQQIDNDLLSLKWQEQNKWINKVENEILKSTEECCIRMYCQALKDDCKYNHIQFKDLKRRCNKLFKKYRHLKPFDNLKCHKEYGKCINIWN